MKKNLIILTLLWILCGIITTGTSVAFFQGKFPKHAKEEYRRDLGWGVLYGLTGPVGLVVTSCMSGFWEYGWTLLPPKD